MKKLVLGSLLLLLFGCSGKYKPSSTQVLQTPRDARHGGVFTPKGDLKVLVVFAGFENDADQKQNKGWEYKKENNTTMIPAWSDELFYPDYHSFSPEANDYTLSNYFYQMSNKQFRITAEVFPERINIPATTNNNRSWSNYGKMVFSKLENHPQFESIDFQGLDTRKNNPRFLTDNSNSERDGEIDYVIICWRYNGADPTGTTGLYRASGSGGGFAGITNYTFKNGMKITSGFTICKGLKVNPTSVRGLFVHEFSHSLFNNPHLYGANNVVGKYFYTGAGWAMTGNVMSTMVSASGWERWYLGWINPMTIAKDSIKKGNSITVVVDDFITTGEAIRIRIPNLPEKYGKQYLWLENHAGKSNFDNRTVFVHNGKSEVLPPPPRGVLAYIENITDDHEDYNQFGDGANGLRVIHGKGNYDFQHSQERYTNSNNQYIPGKNDNPREWWGNIIYDYKKGERNPLSGLHTMMKIRGNYSGNGFFPEDDYIRLEDKNMNGSGKRSNEHFPVIMLNGKFVYGELGSDMALRERQVLGMGTNPTIVNLAKYNPYDQVMDPIYLNGLKVEVLKYLGNGKVKVKISFDEVRLQSDTRWAGSDIRLTNITEDEEPDLIVGEGQTLTISNSGTANRHLKNDAGTFINPTVFSIEALAKVKMEKGSTIIVQKGATLIFTPKSVLSLPLGAEIIREEGAEVLFEDGAILITEDGQVPPDFVK